MIHAIGFLANDFFAVRFLLFYEGVQAFIGAFKF